MCVIVYVCMSVCTLNDSGSNHAQHHLYALALVSRLLKIISLFSKIAL